MKQLRPPLTADDVQTLHCGDEVRFSGVIYTARDAAHLRMMEQLRRGEPLPIPMEGAVLYYVGPCPAPPGHVIGSAGPTTSGRMDQMTIPLLEAGLKGMIGKGGRSQEVIDAMVQHGAVYFAALGGAGALIAASIKEVEVVAYPDLGPEAIHKLIVEDLTAVVAVDSHGKNLYSEGRRQYQR